MIFEEKEEHKLWIKLSYVRLQETCIFISMQSSISRFFYRCAAAVWGLYLKDHKQFGGSVTPFPLVLFPGFTFFVYLNYFTFRMI